jgi:hypothetical protein
MLFLARDFYIDSSGMSTPVAGSCGDWESSGLGVLWPNVASYALGHQCGARWEVGMPVELKWR